MYLHLGQSVVVPFRDVIGVFDLDNTTSSPISRQFLTRAEKAGQVTTITEELPASFILCDEGIYLSQLSTATLLKRAENNSFE